MTASTSIDLLELLRKAGAACAERQYTQWEWTTFLHSTRAVVDVPPRSHAGAGLSTHEWPAAPLDRPARLARAQDRGGPAAAGAVSHGTRRASRPTVARWRGRRAPHSTGGGNVKGRAVCPPPVRFRTVRNVATPPAAPPSPHRQPGPQGALEVERRPVDGVAAGVGRLAAAGSGRSWAACGRQAGHASAAGSPARSRP